ncbi:chromate resistance protein ChrB domain-containing protein [Streptomyces marispadix]|uniref:chromate resistance protein ChrB domain-containing protein n=1 Tax=Streptomyces marispadix TaxID=2922868 RepID=UPI003556E642
MKWATRARIHIDRAACAWLIRRHLDQDAEFVFVTDPAPSTRRRNTVRHARGRARPSRR